ncbi:MAG: alpha/beta fold hydrolase [Pseudomonadota bacterium]
MLRACFTLAMVTVAAWLLAMPPALALPPPAPVDGADVRFPSASPFTLGDVGSDAPPTSAVGRLFLPPGEVAGPIPAVVLLHGAGGVMGRRELTYARQFAARGWAALVVDAFASRVERGTGFTGRLLNVTEAMLLADAYAGLAWLAEQPGIDAERVALVGFSYGGMAATYALQAQVAELYQPAGALFRAHVAFYSPCIVRFDDVRTTGAPYLMLFGTNDAIVDPDRCNAVLGDLRAGGSSTELAVYPGAAHQWDARSGGGWQAPRGLAECDFRVTADGRVRDNRTLLTLDGYLGRAAALAWCADDRGYRIEGNPRTRQLSDQRLDRFLGAAFGG